jgi:hypothetical protein
MAPDAPITGTGDAASVAHSARKPATPKAGKSSTSRRAPNNRSRVPNTTRNKQLPAASQQQIMAKGLQDASADLKETYTSAGPWAQKQLQFYPPGSPARRGLAGLVRASGGSGPLPSGYGAAHVGGEMAELGLAAMGMPSAGIVAGAGTQIAEPLLSGVMKGFQRQGLQGRLANLYPSLTGQFRDRQPASGRSIEGCDYGPSSGWRLLSHIEKEK